MFRVRCITRFVLRIVLDNRFERCRFHVRNRDFRRNYHLKAYSHINVRPQFVDDRLRAVVEELIGVRHVVDVDLDRGNHRRLRPPPERL